LLKGREIIVVGSVKDAVDEALHLVKLEMVQEICDHDQKIYVSQSGDKSVHEGLMEPNT
jgi:hypothetical protein